jgi:hypothetical protein
MGCLMRESLTEIDVVEGALASFASKNGLLLSTGPFVRFPDWEMLHPKDNGGVVRIRPNRNDMGICLIFTPLRYAWPARAEDALIKVVDHRHYGCAALISAALTKSLPMRRLDAMAPTPIAT